jgi:uncharacterized protein
MTLAVAVGLGLLIGLALGALGGGGSILTVPALVYLLGEPPHAAATASLIIVGVTALSGTLIHARAGTVQWKQGFTFGVLGILGSYAGSRLSAAADPQLLLFGFAVLMLLAAAAMLRRFGRDGADAPGHSEDDGDGQGTGTRRARPGNTMVTGPRLQAGRVGLTASAVGLLTGFFGVGGGFVVVPALVLVLGFEMRVAVGTSLLVVAVNAATALAARLGTVEVDWAVVLPFTVAAIAGAGGGGRLAGRARPQTLARAFAYLLVVLAGYVAARSLPHLL